MNTVDLARTSVLVIDDEEEIGELIAAACEGVGLRCTVTTRHDEFLRALQADVGVLVIDLMMPEVDGIEILRRVAGERRGARIILMSGFDRKVLGSAETMAQSLGLEVVGSLFKPFRIADAEALLANAATRKEAAPAPARQVRELPAQELRQALAAGQVDVHYQPQVALASGRVVGVEALARLQIPGRPLVYPDAFIGVAERSGQIEALTIAVMDRSVSEFGGLGLADGMTLSINVSALTLNDVSLPDRLAPFAARRGIGPERMVIEITESGLIQELATALDILARLRLKGFGLSIDDFGTGYAAMAQLKRVPATELKVDRLFVSSMLADEHAATVVRKTVELGHELEMKVVAEGIETAEQEAALRQTGCDIGQGYFYARPMPIESLRAWLAARG